MRYITAPAAYRRNRLHVADEGGNRARFKANERAYIDEWPMSEEQRRPCWRHDLNRCIELGATSIPCQIAPPRQDFRRSPHMTGMTEDQYRDMMVKAGPFVEGNRYVGREVSAISPPASTPRQCRRSARRSIWQTATTLFGSRCSRATILQAVVEGYHKRTSSSISRITATAFSLDMIPTFAIGTAADSRRPTRVGAGARCPR